MSHCKSKEENTPPEPLVSWELRMPIQNSHDSTPPLSLRWLVAEEPDDDDQQRLKT